MRQGGFTLVELIITIAIMAILLSIATLNWNEMQRKSAIESQVKTMHADLMEVRLQALYGKRKRSVVLSVKQFAIYSSNETSVTPISRKDLSYPIAWNSGNTVTFESSGLTNTEKSICVDPSSDNPGAIDSIVISTARINIGKRQSGGSCVTGNIDQK